MRGNWLKELSMDKRMKKSRIRKDKIMNEQRMEGQPGKNKGSEEKDKVTERYRD